MTISQSNGSSATGLSYIFRALRHRNYRLFFIGQGTSVIGTWMQGATLSWLVMSLAIRQGVSPEFWLGLIPFVGQLPTFLLPIFTGVLADRWSRRRIMLCTQSLAMLQSFTLGLLAYLGIIELWQVMCLALSLGLISSFDIPARQSFVVHMIDDRNDLTGAIALNSSVVNFARLIAPPIAGWIIARYSVSVCFFINSASYLAVIVALLAMRVPPQPPRVHRHVLHGLVEGFHYVASSPPIRSVLMLLALISFMGVTYGVVMSRVATNELAASAKAWGLAPAQTFGFLLGGAGFGALIGVGYLASRRSVRGMKTIIAVGAGIFGAALVAFSFSHTLWISLPLMAAVGFGMMTTTSASNTFLQAIVDDDKRGRVMSFWVMSFMGMVPFGSLFSGSVAHSFGRMTALRVGGLACMAGAAIFATRLRKLRAITFPIYRQKQMEPPLPGEGVVPGAGGGETEIPPMIPPEK